MSNVVSINCTSDYLLKRAERHRRAGRYDDAMALLWKAKNQDGPQEEIELAFARVYDEMGCEQEAARAYLRVVRSDGKHKAQALFHLSVSAVQRGDFDRALSYYEQFALIKDQTEISEEMSLLLAHQLQENMAKPVIRNRKAYARELERRAAMRLQEGKITAARHLMEHAMRLWPRGKAFTMMACCCLMQQDVEQAVAAAETAHALSPGDVQTMCVLCDAYAAAGESDAARRMMYWASLRAKEADDCLAVAVESAKYGEDLLTLRMTKALLKREPYHTQGMILRGCALINLGRFKSASRLLGRVCGLLPEDSICAYHYRLALEAAPVGERLMLGADVTHEEGVKRASELIGVLYMDPQQVIQDTAQMSRICRLCEWALHSPMAGSHTKTVALILLAALQLPQASEVLLDTLTDPSIHESIKLHVLQVLTSRDGFKPYYVDMNGRLMRLAAGGVSQTPVRSVQAHSRIVQRASDALEGKYPGAAKAMLDAYLKYLARYGQPDKRHEAACTAALEYHYLLESGKPASLLDIANRMHVTPRLIRVYQRRFARCTK